jgi:hypothetical protein
MPGRVVVCGHVVYDIYDRPVEQVGWEATTPIDDVDMQLGGRGSAWRFRYSD